MGTLVDEEGSECSEMGNGWVRDISDKNACYQSLAGVTHL